ncbi:MAG: TM2 domain-containing protein [Myxococcales bacterium]|nr:TM2 domain-containing protein [Myxococcales bacterium]
MGFDPNGGQGNQGGGWPPAPPNGPYGPPQQQHGMGPYAQPQQAYPQQPYQQPYPQPMPYAQPQWGAPPAVGVIVPHPGVAMGMVAYPYPPKLKGTALLLALLPAFFGFFGFHSFYAGKPMIGIMQFLTLGGCGIWQLVDIISIASGTYRDANGQPIV